MPETHFDLVIIGAGLIGVSLAVALQRQGLKIAILEKHLPDFTVAGTHDERPISLALGSKKILDTLELWSKLESCARAIEEVQVKEQGVLGGVHFKAAALEVPALGYVVPFSTLYRTLYQAAASLAEVTIIPIENLEQITSQAEQAELSVQTATGLCVFTADLVVGCDGARSRVRELMKLRVKETQSDEVSMTALLEFEKHYPAIALERFTRQGVLALLPLHEKSQCGLVWTMTKSHSTKVEAWSEQQFIQEMQQQFRQQIPPIIRAKRGAIWPLQTITCKKPYKSNVILIGNSAHTIYPLAAQGFNLGLRDVAVLAEVLVAARAAGRALGSEENLADYCKQRVKDQERILSLTSNLTRIFSARLPLLAPLRGLGMLMFDMATPLKVELAKLTMGLGGHLPKLVRGVPLWQDSM